jgi:prolyl 4-hydroxylase
LDTSDALHGGQPVKSGEKWVCNLWVHKYPY